MATRIGSVGVYPHVAIALVSILALGACTGGAEPTASRTSVPTEHDVPTGTQLKSVLLTAADLPAGFTEESTGAQDSGATLSEAAAGVNLGSAGCDTILNTIGQTGFGEASYASDAFTPASSLGEFDETLLEFHRTDAAAFFSALRTAMGRCSSFKASDETGGTENASLNLSPGPKTGDESLGFTVKVSIAGQTMVEQGVAVRAGTAVLVLDDSGVQGAGAALDPASAAVLLQKRLTALH